jgi:hypothetical protein
MFSCGTILSSTLYSADSSIGNGSVLYTDSGLNTHLVAGIYQLVTGGVTTNVNVDSSGVVFDTQNVIC